MMLHGKQIRLQAKSRTGRPLPLSVSLDDHTVHFTVGRGSDQIDVYVDATALSKAMYELKTGKKYVSGKHASKGENNG